MSEDRAPSRAGEWLKCSGPDSDIVISSRIRLARNIAGFHFKSRLAEDDSARLCEHLRARIAAADLEPGLEYVALRQLSDIDRLVLVERHLISLDHANAEGERGVVRNAQGSLALMVNEEDHLRIQVIRSGMALDETFERAMRVENDLKRKLEFAFHPRFGYLTSCPTNVGTGLRISVMLHLPALVMTKQIDKVFNAVAKMNLAVRGFYGEGTKALSDLYQISNQVTLGKAPEAILEQVRHVLPKIVSFEREVRRQLVEGDRILVEDRVWRAFGLLGAARSMSSEEAFDLLSTVRMGVHLGVLSELDIATVNDMFMVSQPGHLQALRGGVALEPTQRDVVRAQILRERLQQGRGAA